MTEATHRTEDIVKEFSVDLPGSRHAKSKIVVKYSELRAYVTLYDCNREIAWLLDYDNEQDEEKLNDIIEIFKKINLKRKK